MPKTYSIKWIIDDALAQATFRRGEKALGDIEAKALRAAKALESVHAASATAAVNNVQKMASAANAANQQAVAGARKRVSDIEAIELKWSVRDYKIRVKAEADKQRLDDFARARHEKAIRDRESLEAAWLAREYKERVAFERRKETAALGPNGRLSQVRRRELTEEQLQLAARNRAYDVAHKKRVDQILKEKYETRDCFGEAIAGAVGFGGAMTTAGAAVFAIGTGKDILGTLTGALRDAKKASEEMARQVLDTSAALREIAAIKGKYAPDDAELAQHLNIRKASGLTHTEAVDYSAELRNVLGTVDLAKFSETERDKLEKLGAQQVARRGGARVAAPLARTQALIADFVKPGADGKVRAEDVMSMVDAVDVINSMGAASQAVSTAQSNELMTALTAPDLKGSFADPRKAVALNTIASKFEPNGSAEASLQAIRQARGFTKWRQGKGMTASQAETLRAAGISETDDPEQSMRKLFQFAQKEMKPDEAFDAFLARRGFRDQTGNKRLAQFYGEYRRGNFDRVMGEADKPLTSEYEEKTRGWLGSQPGRDALAKVAIDAAKLDRGKRAVELTIAKEEAEAEYIKEGGDDTFLGRVMNLVGGRDAVIEREAVKSARKRAGRRPGSGLGPVGTLTSGLVSGSNISPLGLFSSTVLNYLGNMIGTQVSGLADSRVEEINTLKKIAENTAKPTTPAPIPVPRRDADPGR